MTNSHGLQSHCQSSIQDFAHGGDYQNLTIGGNIFAHNLTVEHKDNCLYGKNTRDSSLETTFTECQKNHKYIWVHLDIDTDATLNVKVKDCSDTESIINIKQVDSKWITPSGTYTEGFLVKVETGLKSVWLQDCSVDEYKLQELSFIDCPIPSDTTEGPSNYTVGVHNGTAHRNWGMAYHHNGTAHRHNGTGNGTWHHDHTPTPTSNHSENCSQNQHYNGSEIYAPAHKGSEVPAWTPPAKNGSEIYPAWSPSSSPTPWAAPEAIVAAVPAPVVPSSEPEKKHGWSHYNARDEMYGKCKPLVIDAFNAEKNAAGFAREFKNVNYNNGSCHVVNKDAAITVVIGELTKPFDIQKYDYALIEFKSEINTAFSIQLQYNNEWHASRYSRIVIPDSNPRSLLLDLKAFKLTHITGIKFNKFNKGDFDIVLRKISLLDCSATAYASNYTVAPVQEAPKHDTPYFVINDFTTRDPHKNIRGYAMGCDNTSDYAHLGNGTLEIKSKNGTYWYTNVGSPCFAQNFTNYKNPGIEIEIEAHDGTEFEIQLEFADSCDAKNSTGDRFDYKVKQLKSKDYCNWGNGTSTEKFKFPLAHEEFHTLFSIYLMNIKSNGSLKLDHIHVVDIEEK